MIILSVTYGKMPNTCTVQNTNTEPLIVESHYQPDVSVYVCDSKMESMKMEVDSLQEQIYTLIEMLMLISSKLGLQDQEPENFQKMRNEHVDRIMQE